MRTLNIQPASPYTTSSCSASFMILHARCFASGKGVITVSYGISPSLLTFIYPYCHSYLSYDSLSEWFFENVIWD